MKSPPFRQSDQGFTLIEVMITVAIIGILAAIAYPSYTAYVVRSQRVDVQRQLIMHAQALERLHSVGGSYQNAAGDACGINDPDNNQYVIETECGDANSFTITATPNDGGIQAADGTQTLDQSGARGGSVQNGQWTN